MTERGCQYTLVVDEYIYERRPIDSRLLSMPEACKELVLAILDQSPGVTHEEYQRVEEALKG